MNTAHLPNEYEADFTCRFSFNNHISSAVPVYDDVCTAVDCRRGWRTQASCARWCVNLRLR